MTLISGLSLSQSKISYRRGEYREKWKNVLGKMGKRIRERREIVAGELPSVDLICKKCGRQIGQIFDGQYLEIGSARFWNTTHFTCRCYRPHVWNPRVDRKDGRDGLNTATREILINLGKEGSKKL